MGTIVDHPSLTRRGLRGRHSALHLAVAAARTSLTAAGCPPSDLDLLVNAGLYHDRNLGEPALAALIQQDIGANPEDPHPDAHGTFSFDVANGACGVLTALQVIDGFLRSGAIRRALVVASDADPGHGRSLNFPFASAGGALLCRWSDDESGLGPVRWANVPDGGDAFRATLGLHDGRNMVTFADSSTMDKQFAEAAVTAARECLDDAAVGLAGVDLIVAAPPRPDFTAALAAGLGVEADRIAVARDHRIHTAALVAAVRDAMAAGRLGPGSTALLVTAGAGVTAGAALYRTPV
ncbi:MAG TPA: 3-oxoacyl-[acyl-carrier-protein] synthase III C-terminal domain-containing protein [Pseudonocardiaceae bacterium]